MREPSAWDCRMFAASRGLGIMPVDISSDKQRISSWNCLIEKHKS